MTNQSNIMSNRCRASMPKLVLLLLTLSSMTNARIHPEAISYPLQDQRQSASTESIGLPKPLQGPLAFYLNDGDRLASSRQIQVPRSNATLQPQQEEEGYLPIPHVRRRRRQQVTQYTPLKAFFYFIQALGRSDNLGCKHPQPAFTASCPYGAFIVSQSANSEWQSRLDCNQTSATEIHCVPKQITQENELELDLEDRNGVTIACYGTYNTEDDSEDEGFDPWENLQVSVQVEPGSYYCDKALEVKVVPHPTVITGGSVYQTVAIQKQCYQSTRD